MRQIIDHETWLLLLSIISIILSNLQVVMVDHDEMMMVDHEMVDYHLFFHFHMRKMEKIYWETK